MNGESNDVDGTSAGGLGVVVVFNQADFDPVEAAFVDALNQHGFSVFFGHGPTAWCRFHTSVAPDTFPALVYDREHWV